MEMSNGSEKVAEEMEHITANVRNTGQGSQGEDEYLYFRLMFE